MGRLALAVTRRGICDDGGHAARTAKHAYAGGPQAGGYKGSRLVGPDASMATQPRAQTEWCSALVS